MKYDHFEQLLVTNLFSIVTRNSKSKESVYFIFKVRVSICFVGSMSLKMSSMSLKNAEKCLLRFELFFSNIFGWFKNSSPKVDPKMTDIVKTQPLFTVSSFWTSTVIDE